MKMWYSTKIALFFIVYVSLYFFIVKIFHLSNREQIIMVIALFIGAIPFFILSLMFARLADTALAGWNRATTLVKRLSELC